MGNLTPLVLRSLGQGLASVLLRWSSRALLSRLGGLWLVGFVLALIPKLDLASPFTLLLGPGVNCWGLSFDSYSSVGQFSGLSSGSRGGGCPGGAKRWKGLGVGHTCLVCPAGAVQYKILQYYSCSGWRCYRSRSVGDCIVVFREAVPPPVSSLEAVAFYVPCWVQRVLQSIIQSWPPSGLGCRSLRAGILVHIIAFWLPGGATARGASVLIPSFLRESVPPPVSSLEAVA